MFILSQYILKQVKICNTNDITTYSIAIGLIIYTSIYLYLLFYNDEYLSIFNKFIIYIIAIDLLLSTFYYINDNDTIVNDTIVNDTIVNNTNDNLNNKQDISAIKTNNSTLCDENEVSSDDEKSSYSDTYSDTYSDNLDTEIETDIIQSEINLNKLEQFSNNAMPNFQNVENTNTLPTNVGNSESTLITEQINNTQQNIETEQIINNNTEPTIEMEEIITNINQNDKGPSQMLDTVEVVKKKRGRKPNSVKLL